jgi:hypothetical protein
MATEIADLHDAPNEGSDGARRRAPASGLDVNPVANGGR